MNYIIIAKDKETAIKAIPAHGDVFIVTPREGIPGNLEGFRPPVAVVFTESWFQGFNSDQLCAIRKAILRFV